MLNTSWPSRLAFVSLLAAMIPIVGLHAQAGSASTGTGSVTGFLLDPLGGGVPDITLYFTNTATRRQHRDSTNKAGYYEVDKLPAGTYRVTAEVGFAPPSTVTIEPDQRVEHTITMRLGGVDMKTSVCAECVAVVGTPFTPPESLRLELERDEEWIRSQPVVGARFPGPEQWFRFGYPEALRKANIEGTVVIEGRVGTDGFPTALRVASSAHPELAKAGLEALKDMQWEPARVRGVAVEVPLSVTIEFMLRPRASPPGN